MTLLVWIAACSLAVGSATADVSEQKQDDETVVSKSVTGTVVAMTRRTLSLEVTPASGETEEMLLPFSSDMALARLKSLSELRPGDTVTVGYRQTYRQDADGNERLLKTVVTSIELVRSGVKALGSRERDEGQAL